PAALQELRPRLPGIAARRLCLAGAARPTPRAGEPLAQRAAPVSSGSALRVTLRPLTAEDADAVAPWLAEAVAAVDGARLGADTAATLDGFCDWTAHRWPNSHRDAIRLKSEPAGFLVWRPCALTGPKDLQIDALAVRRDLRNLGHGVEAVARLEEQHAKTTVYAPIPRTNGLALYFWLRA